MNQYRITKYDPALRDARGAYTRDEWTSFGDVGRSFGGVVLTEEAYQRVEDAYIAVALAFLREAGVGALTVRGMELPDGAEPSYDEGDVIALDALDDVIRGLLREDFWCRLEGVEGFVDVGWDFYLYVGVPRPCPEAERLAREVGLYVEVCPSPHRV